MIEKVLNYNHPIKKIQIPLETMEPAPPYLAVCGNSEITTVNIRFTISFEHIDTSYLGPYARLNIQKLLTYQINSDKVYPFNITLGGITMLSTATESKIVQTVSDTVEDTYLQSLIKDYDIYINSRKVGVYPANKVRVKKGVFINRTYYGGHNEVSSSETVIAPGTNTNNSYTDQEDEYYSFSFTYHHEGFASITDTAKETYSLAISLDGLKKYINEVSSYKTVSTPISCDNEVGCTCNIVGGYNISISESSSSTDSSTNNSLGDSPVNIIKDVPDLTGGVTRITYKNPTWANEYDSSTASNIWTIEKVTTTSVDGTVTTESSTMELSVPTNIVPTQGENINTSLGQDSEGNFVWVLPDGSTQELTNSELQKISATDSEGNKSTLLTISQNNNTTQVVPGMSGCYLPTYSACQGESFGGDGCSSKTTGNYTNLQTGQNITMSNCGQPIYHQ